MTTLILFYIFIFGLIVGSFINCLLWRLHTGESIMGRSYCPKCKNQIAWYDNIPVFSFLFLKGKCRKCHKQISFQYPLVEFTVGVLFTLVFLHFFKFQISNFDPTFLDSGFMIQMFRDLFFVAVMVIVFIYDLKYYLILDRITLPAIFIITISNLVLGYHWQYLLIGILVGGGFFLAQFLVSKGRWIGGGDIRLGALMGVMFSWPMILLALFLSYISGAIISIFLVIFGKKKMDSQVPFGIFLTSASIITLFWGDIILNWYLSLL